MRPIVASDLMTLDVLSVPGNLSLAELAAFLVDHQISGAAVVDEDQRFIGVVSATDVATAAAEGGERIGWGRTRNDFYARGWESKLDREDLSTMRLEEDGLRVRDVMTPTIYSVPMDATASEVATTMLKSHLHRLLVTDGDEIVGIISTSDLLGLLVDERESVAS